MEKTKFQEALTAFNNDVRKVAEEVRKQMAEIGIDEVGKYKIVKVRAKGCTKKYLAVIEESIANFKQYKSLEDFESNYFLYSSDEWIEAATLEDKLSFMHGLNKVLDEIDVKRSEIIGRMNDAVADADRSLNPIQELPGFEGTMEAVEEIKENQFS